MKITEINRYKCMCLYPANGYFIILLVTIEYMLNSSIYPDMDTKW